MRIINWRYNRWIDHLEMKSDFLGSSFSVLGWTRKAETIAWGTPLCVPYQNSRHKKSSILSRWSSDMHGFWWKALSVITSSAALAWCKTSSMRDLIQLIVYIVLRRHTMHWMNIRKVDRIVRDCSDAIQIIQKHWACINACATLYQRVRVIHVKHV